MCIYANQLSLDAMQTLQAWSENNENRLILYS